MRYGERCPLLSAICLSALLLAVCADGADVALPLASEIERLTAEEAERLICKNQLPCNAIVNITRFVPVNEQKAGGVVIQKLVRHTSTESLACQGALLSLPKLTKLSAETAAVLSKHNGILQLDALITVDKASAEALSRFRGTLLTLDGVKEINRDAAKALGNFEGDTLSMATLCVELGKKLPLTPDSARLVCALSSGQLPAVTAFDSPDAVAIAKALATRKGPLSLPNLKKISPKTLSALIEKEDVEIPLIEALELIPEPDGSPTEDFVIPEAFQKK